jgi:hypothetical protein
MTGIAARASRHILRATCDARCATLSTCSTSRGFAQPQTNDEFAPPLGAKAQLVGSWRLRNASSG